MIRSLVIAANTTDTSDGTSDAGILRRNLSQESLESCLAEGSTIWIDIVAPEAEEISWIENCLQLSPTVVADLLREDRRPTLLVYPQYIFLSLFQPHAHGNTLLGNEIHCIIGEHFYVTVRQADTSALEELMTESSRILVLGIVALLTSSILRHSTLLILTTRFWIVSVIN